MNPASLRVDGFDKGASLVQRIIGNLTDSLAVATRGEAHAAIADHGPTKISVLRRMQPEESVRPVGSQAVAVGGHSWSDWRATNPSSTFTRADSTTQASLPLLRRFHSWTEQGEQASSAVVRSAMHDMLLAPRLGTESRGSSLLQLRSSGAVVQTGPQAPTPASTAVVPISGREEAKVLETRTGASQTQADLDELIEQVWQKLMHKLTIEQERRGCTGWL